MQRKFISLFYLLKSLKLSQNLQKFTNFFQNLPRNTIKVLKYLVLRFSESKQQVSAQFKTKNN